MRRISSVALALAAILPFAALSARIARADDDKPGFSVGDVALSEKGLPEGWKAAPSEQPPSADEKAIRDEVDAIAKAKSEEPLIVARAFATADGKPISLVLVDTEKDPKAFSAAMKESAAKHGWGFQELGYPARIALVAGPEDARAKVLAAQSAYAVKLLVIKAEGGVERALFTQAANSAASGLAIDPKNAPCHLVLGLLEAAGAARQMHGRSFENAIVHLNAAIAKDATSPLTGAKLSKAYGELGGALLNTEPPKDAEGRDALKEAVRIGSGTDISKDELATYRYNLACAHGRLKEKDESFALLTKLLAELEKAPNEQLESIWREDKDFTNLKDDPRWTELMKKYPEKKDGGGGN